MNTYWYWIVIAFVLVSQVSTQEPTKPEARAGHELVWDEDLGMVLLVNGDHIASHDPGIVWGWNGETWQIVSEDAPPSRTLGGVAYLNHQLVLHGGSLSVEDNSGETWLWDGSAWQLFEGITPGVRDHFAMTSTGDEIVLHGGMDLATDQYYQDTWIWDGSAWTQAATEGLFRYHYALAYDSLRDQVLLFGGTTGSNDANDLWAWDGKSWQKIDRGTGPSRRSHARMAFDEASGNMILFGGFTTSRVSAETWLWDGAAWTEYTAGIAPPARGLHSMAYDPLRQKIVMFGGYDDTNLDDTWEWDIEHGWREVGE
jgi:Galactose oxidase, central domain